MRTRFAPPVAALAFLLLPASAAVAAPAVTVDQELRRYTRAQENFVVAPTAQVVPDTPLKGAAVTLGEGAVAGEDELVTGLLPSGISAAPFDPATGTLSLSGIASGADYQAALRAVTYRNTSEAPTEGERRIAFTVHDGIASGPPGIARVLVERRPAPPPRVISGPSGPDPNSTVTFVFEGEPGGQFACTLDQEPERRCTSPTRIENLVPGSHAFAMRQILDGNLSEPVIARWVYSPPGGTPPDVELTIAPRASIHPFTTAFAVADRGRSLSARCRLRVGITQTCAVALRTGAYALAGAGSANAVGADGWASVPVALTVDGVRELAAHPFGLGLKVEAHATGVNVARAETVGLMVLFRTLRPTLKLSRLFRGSRSATVSPAGRAWAVGYARDIGRLKRIRCVVSGRDRTLARRRARATCAALRAAAPQVSYTSAGKRSSPRQARVTFELTTP